MSRNPENLPVVYDGARQSDVRQEFASMVECDSYILPPEERRILQGENPFKVWREHACMSKHAVAELMGLDELDYIGLEESEFDPTTEEVISFCQAVGVHPTSMISNDPWLLAVVGAMLHAHDHPRTYSLVSQTTTALVDGDIIAEAKRGYDDVYAAFCSLSISYPQCHALTLEFLEKILKADGHWEYAEDSIFDIAKSFKAQAMTERNDAQTSYARYSEQWHAHSRIYHRFGLYLYHDDRSHVTERLFDDMKKRDVYEVMADYLKDPQYIGMRYFPELTSPILLDGRTYTWRQAQREHAKYAEVIFLASRERNLLKTHIDSLGQQCDIFEQWINSNYQRLERFENRQFILKHDDFKDLVKTFRPYAPNTRSLSPELIKMFPNLKGVRLIP